MDYCIAKLKKEGFIIWLTWFNCRYLTPEDAEIIDEPNTADEWRSALKELQKPQYRLGSRLVWFFDRRAKAVFKKHIAKVLTHFSQWTGLAMKDEPAIGIYELTNELPVYGQYARRQGKDRLGA